MQNTRKAPDSLNRQWRICFPQMEVNWIELFYFDEFMTSNSNLPDSLFFLKHVCIRNRTLYHWIQCMPLILSVNYLSHLPPSSPATTPTPLHSVFDMISPPTVNRYKMRTRAQTHKHTDRQVNS